MRILTIGNSFSCDATTYLHDVAKASGAEIDVVNLNIGGCTLETHYRNMLSENESYGLQINGYSSGFGVSLKKALLSGGYDVITLQQASHFSFDADSYFPYIERLADYVRLYQPKAKIYVHETWAYEDGSARLNDVAKFATRGEMYSALHGAYLSAEKEISADGIIPSGALFEKLVQRGLSVHRDTFHASYDVGRYALALLWTAFLTGADIGENAYDNPDHPVDAETRKIIIDCVKETLK